MAAGIQINEASFGYTKNNRLIKVLQNINLACSPGDFIGIAGVNGSGKSTLLKSLCGLLPLLEGNIVINGIPLSQITNNDLAKQISIVLTEKISGFNLTAFDAIAAGQLPYTNIFNRLEPAHLEVIQRAAELCGIKDHLHKPLSELSDGLFQKTMIAKSIAQQTSILLLDEPTAFLDYASKHELFKLLGNLSSQNQKCVLVSSHDLDLILKYCNKVLLVKDSSAELLYTQSAYGHKIFTELSGGYL
ncbi:MAG: ABC transporter ATP-binding protein [Bacteroidetes bacterium]|nr:ABC transporter ATP-binding protein [Bacteroidota bacterium]